MTKSCYTCSHAFLKDYGYSNYTVEGTTLHCNYHPNSPFDCFYGEAEGLNWAKNCPHYTEGDAEHECVEPEED